MTIKHNTPVTLTLTLSELIDVRCALADQVVANRREGLHGLADDCNRAFDAIETQTKDFLSEWRTQYDDPNVLDEAFDDGNEEELTAFMRHATAFVAAAFVALSLLFTGAAQAEGKAFVPYDQALSTCSAEWKQSDERAKLAKGQKQEAWQKFRADCVTRHGYVKGAKAPK